jgi:hypothetical protein
MSTNIFVDLNLNGLSGSSLNETIVLNERELQLNLNFTYTPNIDLTKLKIIFDNKTQSYEFDDIRNTYILKKNASYDYAKKDIIQLRLFYSNFNVFEYNIPLIFVPPSTLEFFDGSSIQNAQFIDTKENDDLFFVMKNNKNQFFNFRSGSNVVTYRTYIESISATQDRIIPIITATLTSNSAAFIENEFGEFIEATT